MRDMNIFLKLIIAAFVLAILARVFELSGIPSGALWLAMIALYFIMRKKPDSNAKKSKKDKAEAHKLSPGGVYIMDGVNDVLEVFNNKVTITPKTDNASIIVRGLKGTKSIPYSSITTVQFRKANPINGYIQLSLAGAIESGGGVINAISDENTVFFTQWNNELAEKIRDYIEDRLHEIKRPQPSQVSGASLSDEIRKLSELKAQGVMSDAEFDAAKRKLIKG
jgi:hypothetical protein